ncbi:MAG: FG-GAP-like repeat-containing protein, partial [Syntrophobacterales bacterium]
KVRMHYIKKYYVLVLIIPLLFTAAGSAAETPKKVAILPFEINAPEDLSYLREGIMDMLASRISWEGKVEAIEEQLVKEALSGHEAPLNEAAAREVGTTLGADYVLFGSLTVFGESVSIDAKMIALKEDRPPVSVYAQTKGMGEVIPRINDFAQDINNKIFGRGSARVAAAPSQPRFSRAHPETIMSGPAPSTSAPRDGGSFMEMQSGREAGSDVLRSQKLSFPALGMDVGDVDGDGRPEIVVLSKLREVIVYQWDQGRLTKRGSFQGEKRDKLVWVCLVDANHDGRAEVYVSNLHDQRLSSYVLEWRGDRLKKLATDIQWYFNRLTVPGKETILLGQKKNMQDIFIPGVYHIQFAGGSYKPLEGISLPRRANVFNFTQGDVDGDGKPETVFIGPEDRLYLVDDDGTRLWQSREYYGATANILEGRPLTGEIVGRSTVDSETEAYYIPSPLLLVDLNSDKRLEILANRNVSLSSRILANQRRFSDGEIQSLAWVRDNIVPQWKTRPLRGMVVSYRLADVDGDGQDELVAAAVMERGILKKTKSTIYVYELDEVRALSGKTSTPAIIESNM